MAITVHIYYSGKGDHAIQFAREMLSSGIVDRIRAEEGNLQYEYFVPMDDESTVLLIDRWANQEALDIHHASPMMQQIIALREKYDLHMKVERYTSEQSEMPDKDKAFIKE
ncbi:MAG: antibiotic biosynthesis monooxygenase [Clostridiales bacterium]|nr:antibiotic biosynthesis monooxygenase [Clostridiales bacterium]